MKTTETIKTRDKASFYFVLHGMKIKKREGLDGEVGARRRARVRIGEISFTIGLHGDCMKMRKGLRAARADFVPFLHLFLPFPINKHSNIPKLIN